MMAAALEICWCLMPSLNQRAISLQPSAGTIASPEMLEGTCILVLRPVAAGLDDMGVVFCR